jgi:hypothetical protein
MATETQTIVGECLTHGTVDATRELPRVTFPPLITAAQRAIAMRRRPYRCPHCGAAVETE